jgi:hypothetical protein
MTEPADDTLLSIDALPRHTTPTWEVELLISGVAVFAMLQLPGWLDDRWFALRPRLDANWADALLIIYIYAKTAALVLAATFVAHLLLRARWIAQVGMHSVHPEGIRWDRLRMGPVQREVEQQRYVSAEVSIERADNRATTVFAIGVMLASVLLTFAVIALLGYSIAHWGAQALGLPLAAGDILLVVCAAIMVPKLLAIRTDRAAGARLPATGVSRRALAAVFRGYQRLGLGQANNPAMTLVASHGNRLRTALMSSIVIGCAIFAAIFSYHAERDATQFGQYAAFPQPTPDSPLAFDSAHYDDRRNPARDPAVPYVQGAVVSGPYLQLVIPYRPLDDGETLRDACPALARATPDMRPTVALACLRQAHALALDGRPVAADVVVGSDARTDRPALIAMIDIRALPAGKHVLLVARSAGAVPASAQNARRSPDRIVFWR